MVTEEHFQHAERLRDARKNLPKKFKDKARFVAKKVSLLNQLNPYLDWLYGIALSAAMLKDILDLVVIGSLPVIGTVITLMATITIWAVMIITGSAFKAFRKRRLIKRYGLLAVGTLVEMVFGIDFLPIETCMVVYIFVSVLQDRRDAKEKSDLQTAQTQTI
jgi:hypothetical protein